MDIALLVASASIVLTLASIGITYFMFKKMRLETPLLLDTLAERVGSSLREHVDSELEPAKHMISRAMSDRGVKGASARQLKKAEGLLAQDVMNMQVPEIQLALEMFPNLKEYVEEKPDLLIQLMPRIQALLGDKDFSIEKLLNPSLSPAKPHSLPKHMNWE